MGIFGSIVNVAKKAVSTVGGAVKSVAGAVSSVASKVRGAVSSVASKVGGAASSVGSAISSGVSSAKSTLSSAGKRMESGASKARSTISSGAKSAYEFAKRDIKGETFTTNKDGSPKLDSEGNPIRLLQGTVPIGPAGITSGAKAITTFFGTANKANKARSVANTANAFGKSTSSVQKLVDKALLNKEVAKIAAAKSPAQFAAKMGKWVLGGVAGADILVSWYALDNVITGQKFFLNDLLSGVQGRTVTPEAAEEAIDESQATRDKARSFINLSTRINPLLWAFRSLIMTGINADDNAAALKIAEIKATSEEMASADYESEDDKFSRLREEGQTQFEENQQTIADAREEANRAYDKKREKSDDEYYTSKEESDADFREKTLLFEAIRKRNSGQNLTPEEVALLEKYGLSAQQADTGGRSALNFGMFK